MDAWDNLKSAISTSCGDLAAVVIIDNVPSLTPFLYPLFTRLAWAVAIRPLAPDMQEATLATIQQVVDELGDCAHDIGCKGRPGVEDRIHCNMRRIVAALVLMERGVASVNSVG